MCIPPGRYTRPMTFQQTIELRTETHGQMHDLTERIAAIVREAGVTTGIVNIANVGSTGAIGCIEFEPGLQDDLPTILDKLIPPSRDYGHEQAWHDGNAHAHLQATWLGQHLSLPVSDGQPNLGTWQQVFHLECDIKPRRRKVVVTVMGD